MDLRSDVYPNDNGILYVTFFEESFLFFSINGFSIIILLLSFLP